MKKIVALILFSVSVNVQANEALLQAVEKNDLITVNSLLKSDSTVDVNYSRNISTPLKVAVAHQNIEIVKALLGVKNINVNSDGGYADTPLVIAASKGNEQITSLLLERPELDINLVAGHYNALYAAAASNSIGVMKQLLARKEIQINLDVDNELGTALYGAVAHCNMDAVNVLLSDPKIDINHKAPYIGSLVAWNVFNGSCAYNMFLRLVSDERFSYDGNSLLNSSLIKFDDDSKKIANYLLNLPDFNINAQDTKGNTAIHYAVQGGTESIKLLLSRNNLGLDLNIKNNDGDTALMDLVVIGHVDQFLINFELFKNAGADFNALDKNGNSVLSHCIKELRYDWVFGLPQRMEKIIPLMKSINAQDSDGNTALMLLAEVGDTTNTKKSRELLFQAKAKVNLRNKSGLTALMILKEKGHPFWSDFENEYEGFVRDLESLAGKPKP